ncbi:signal peptidase I [Kroppenstedtia sanguinis]|uniref:Signal peptidase I n=1 Tax=Kroppenstedtia sanguinis TaxID=1380684 RepID=A0ABW4CDE5_9BACL
MGKKARKAVNEWLTAILVAAILMLVVRVFLFAPYEVHGESMYPTFKGEELLIVNMWIYHVSEPEYGDIVVFHTDENRDFIKRVVGKPGDRITLEGGRVIRNGKPLTEPYIPKDSFAGPQVKSRMPETVVPKGHLFVLGDNRPNSRDSRDLGAIKVSEVVGRADIKVKPLNDFKLLFADPQNSL